MVMERYTACQTVAFCGVFPELRRAWASVDNALFLWRFDKWQDVPVEYSGEEQSIVAVGLVKPRPGVFVEAIQHLLVVATTTEIVLLGVCCSAGPGGGGDAVEELALQPLPLYSVPSDNVTVVCVAPASGGRIFLGGADGNLYELQYAAADSWRARRCAKVCHTGGLRQLLPAFLPAFLFGAPQALVELVVDADRHILYARTQASAIQVRRMGATDSGVGRRQGLLGARMLMGWRCVWQRAPLVSRLLPPQQSASTALRRSVLLPRMH
jgi:nuclear pore complex protein Nup155